MTRLTIFLFALLFAVPSIVTALQGERCHWETRPSGSVLVCCNIETGVCRESPVRR
jgi:hypothetical protein